MNALNSAPFSALFLLRYSQGFRGVSVGSAPVSLSARCARPSDHTAHSPVSSTRGANEIAKAFSVVGIGCVCVRRPLVARYRTTGKRWDKGRGFCSTPEEVSAYSLLIHPQTTVVSLRLKRQANDYEPVRLVTLVTRCGGRCKKENRQGDYLSISARGFCKWVMWPMLV
eukprot:1188552-Prorocentrum_minimum.AAC.5